MPQPGARRSDTFLLPEVAEAYRARPPYPDDVIDRLVDLAGGGRVVDLGAGEGSIGRRLVGRVVSVDAVEPSIAMISAGRALPGGDGVAWHCETAENCALPGEFDLAVAGEAMHWFDLPVVIDRLRALLRPGRPLALVDRSTRHTRWPELVEIIKRYSTAPDYDPSYDVAEELTARGLWLPVGELVPTARVFRQTPDDFLAALRSTSSLARPLMSAADNAAFDAAVLECVRPITGSDGTLALDVTARLVWGVIPTTG